MGRRDALEGFLYLENKGSPQVLAFAWAMILGKILAVDKEASNDYYKCL